MAYRTAMDALGDPTRRAIFEQLRRGPRAVGEIAAELPVSRPAVSQHLRVLKDAGLVTERREGTRRLYRLDPDGLGELRGYFDRFWDAALADFKAAAEASERRKRMSTQAETLTIRKSVTVNCSPEHAFAVYTEGIGTWWPFATHSIGSEGKPPETAVFEPRVGGRLYERMTDGEEHDWATVTAWEPPRRFVIDWHVNPESPSTEVEVTFSRQGDGTRVDVEHRGWESYGEKAAESFAGYNSGWDVVLAPFVEKASS